MVVYIEYAFIVNFLLDGLLLYLALACAKCRVHIWRLLLAAGVGGGEALLFPTLTLPNWCAYLLKILGGAVIAMIAAQGGFKTHCAVLGLFFAFTFLLGGILTALYSFFSVPYEGGAGYVIERAPIALVLAVASIFGICAVKFAKAFYRYRNSKRNILSCKLTAGEKSVNVKGFADSGNLLTFRGTPVCVISAVCALALFRDAEPVGRMTVSTVNASKESLVFEGGLVTEGIQTKCYFTVGEIGSKEFGVILHTALLEDAHEGVDRIKGMVKEVRGE